MQASNDRGRPGERAPSNVILSDTSILRHADLVMRCAWLRVHADLLYEVDPSGQLSAHLLDHAGCLEAIDRKGRFT